MTNYINYVLASYFAVAIGSSEEEAISALRKHLAESPEFARDLKAELMLSFDSRHFSWQEVLDANNVLFLETEEAARNYALSILWNPYGNPPIFGHSQK